MVKNKHQVGVAVPLNATKQQSSLSQYAPNTFINNNQQQHLKNKHLESYLTTVEAPLLSLNVASRRSSSSSSSHSSSRTASLNANMMNYQEFLTEPPPTQSICPNIHPGVRRVNFLLPEDEVKQQSRNSQQHSVNHEKTGSNSLLKSQKAKSNYFSLQ